MFNSDLSLYKINREERHSGFLFISELLNNDLFRNKIFSLLKERCGTKLLDSSNFDLYAEVSSLRDYWYNLGDPQLEYSKVHDQRLQLLIQLLYHIGYDKTYLENDLFWTTSNKNNRKLWSPSQWSIEKLKNIEKEKNDLVKIRWAFRAKPDLMIDCPECFMFIEFKVVSSEGKNYFGYKQNDIQDLIGDLMKKLIPVFKNKQFTRISLELIKNGNNISWSEVIDILKECHRDTIGYYMTLRHFEENFNFR